MVSILTTLENLSCRLAHHVIATNESYRDIEIERAGIPPERISIVRNGPATDKLYPLEPQPKPNEPIVLGYLGIIGAQDGVDKLILALHHVITDFQRSDFRCVIAGTGSSIEDMKRLCQTHHLQEYIEFRGWLDYSQVNECLNSFDICIAPEPANPYTERCTMIKMMEYMAVARPIVAFDLLEHRRTAGEAALYAADNDPRLLAEQIVKLMDDPTQRKTMGDLGRERIENLLSWTYQEQALLKAYQSLFSE